MNEVLECCLAGATNDAFDLEGQRLARLEGLVDSWVGGRVRDLRLLWRDGGLELQDSTRTYYVKQLAQHAVMKITPCPIVANAIVVE